MLDFFHSKHTHTHTHKTLGDLYNNKIIIISSQDFK